MDLNVEKIQKKVEAQVLKHKKWIQISFEILISSDYCCVARGTRPNGEKVVGIQCSRR